VRVKHLALVLALVEKMAGPPGVVHQVEVVLEEVVVAQELLVLLLVLVAVMEVGVVVVGVLLVVMVQEVQEEEGELSVLQVEKQLRLTQKQ
jgi:hypothetical protein